MKKYLRSNIIFLLIVSLFVIQSAEARKKRHKSDDDHLRLQHLSKLLDISQDLNHKSFVYIEPKKDCYCACRINKWSCTSTECKAQNKSCENDFKSHEEYSSWNYSDTQKEVSMFDEVESASKQSSRYSNKKSDDYLDFEVREY